MIAQLIPQQLLMCNWCVCVQLDINSPSIIVVQLPFWDIIEARQADTRDTNALHKLIPPQLKLCNWRVCNCNINSPTIKVVCVMIFAPMVNFLAPTQNTPLSAPRKKLLCLISWEKDAKKGPTQTFSKGILGPKNGAPNGPLLATKSWVYCFFPALTQVLSSGRRSHVLLFLGSPLTSTLPTCTFVFRSRRFPHSGVRARVVFSGDFPGRGFLSLAAKKGTIGALLNEKKGYEGHPPGTKNQKTKENLENGKEFSDLANP